MAGTDPTDPQSFPGSVDLPALSPWSVAVLVALLLGIARLRRRTG